MKILLILPILFAVQLYAHSPREAFSGDGSAFSPYYAEWVVGEGSGAWLRMADVPGADANSVVSYTINHGGGFWFDTDSTGALMVMPFNDLTVFDAGPSEFVVTVDATVLYVATYVRLPVAGAWPTLPAATRGTYYSQNYSPSGMTARRAGGALPPGFAAAGDAVQGQCDDYTGVWRSRWIAVDSNGFASVSWLELRVTHDKPRAFSESAAGCTASTQAHIAMFMGLALLAALVVALRRRKP